MKRSTKYSLKYLTASKRQKIAELFKLYKFHLQSTIDLMWDDKIPVKRYMSSKDIIWMGDLGGQYKQLIYKQASEIIRSVKSKKSKKSKPEVKNITIELDERIVTIETSTDSAEFDKWIRLKLPFIQEGHKNRRIEMLIPLKEHKHSLKFKDWDLCKTIELKKDYVKLIYEKEDLPAKTDGEKVAIDIGVNKLITTSKGQIIGSEIKQLLNKLNRRKQKSKNWFQTINEIKNYIGYCVNQLDLNNVNTLVMEELIGLTNKKNGRNNKITRKLLGYWNRVLLEFRLELLCQINRVNLIKVDPSYTSQMCSQCGHIFKNNRQGERFRCVKCGYTADADYNASLNILCRYEEFIAPHACKTGGMV